MYKTKVGHLHHQRFSLLLKGLIVKTRSSIKNKETITVTNEWGGLHKSIFSVSKSFFQNKQIWFRQKEVHCISKILIRVLGSS